MSSFGENLKQLRTNKGMSQGELAQMVQMHATHISRYERNISNPTVEIIKKLCEALEVSADLLIYGDQQRMAEKRIEDTELLRLFTKAQNLEAGEMKCVKSLLEAFITKASHSQEENAQLLSTIPEFLTL